MLQTKANELQKTQILQESRCKNWRLVYDFMPSGIIFFPVEFCELLAATCLRFMVNCVVVTETELEEKKHTTCTAGIIFCLTNTCAQGSGRADCQGEVFRSSFLSRLDSTTLLKGVGEGGLSGGGLVYLKS